MFLETSLSRLVNLIYLYHCLQLVIGSCQDSSLYVLLSL